MKIPYLSDWLTDRRFDRDHRPYLECRPLDTTSGLDGIWCKKHGGWLSECDASLLPVLKETA